MATTFAVISAICLLVGGCYLWWIDTIDEMIDRWPNYKGDDMLDERPRIETLPDAWDDNKQHTEGD